MASLKCGLHHFEYHQILVIFLQKDNSAGGKQTVVNIRSHINVGPEVGSSLFAIFYKNTG